MTTNGIIFPADMLNERIPDEAFKNEVDAIRGTEIAVSIADDWGGFKRLPEPGSRLMYRGWMKTVEEYTSLFNSLLKKDITLITTPENYEAAHHLPGWVEVFSDLTPLTTIVTVDEYTTVGDESIRAAGKRLNVDAFIIKDFVKSYKSAWDTACYAPNIDVLPDIVREFVRLQEDALVGGIVIREFVDLNKTKPEIRVWWAHDEPVLIAVHPDYSHWAEAVTVPDEVLYQVKQKVEALGSPFLTTDLAQKTDGSWIVIEAGDGQVSGFPDCVTDEEMVEVFESVLRK